MINHDKLMRTVQKQAEERKAKAIVIDPFANYTRSISAELDHETKQFLALWEGITGK